MDFVRSLIEGMDESGPDVAAVFDDAIKSAQEVSQILVNKSNKYMNKGQFFQATLFLFIAAWAIVGRMYFGVEMSANKHGKRSAVARVWALIKIAFVSGDDAKAMKRLHTFDKDWEDGKYDDNF